MEIERLPEQEPLVFPKFTEMGQWTVFEDSIQDALHERRDPTNLIRFSAGICTNLVPTAADLAANYGTIDEELVALFLLAGAAWVAMNQAIFKALADSLATGTLGYLIQRFRRTMDGRAAFEALRDACYSSTQAIVRVQTTHNLLSAARWTAGSDLETFIAKHLRGHDILRRHGSDASEQQKLLWFLRGLNDNGDYQSVSLAMGAIATFVQAVDHIRHAVAADRGMNRRGVDRRRAGQVQTGTRESRGRDSRDHSPQQRRGRSSSTNKRTTTKPATKRSRSVPPILPITGTFKKCGLPLHGGDYTAEDIKKIRDAGEYPQLQALRKKIADDVKRKSRSARAVATAELNFDDNESIASQSIISIGTASYRSEASIGSLGEVSSRHLGMVTMGRSVPNQIDVHAANAPNSLRRPDSQPAWLIASLRDGEYDEPSRQVCGFTSVPSVDNRPAWMTRKRPPRPESPEVEVPPVDILDVNAARRDRARARRAATNSSPELVYGDQESDDEDKLIKWARGMKPPQSEPRWLDETREHWYRGSNTKRDDQGKLVLYTPPRWVDGKLLPASTSDPLSLLNEDSVGPPKAAPPKSTVPKSSSISYSYDFADSDDNNDFCKLEAEADLFIRQVGYRDADDYSLGIETAEEFPALEKSLENSSSSRFPLPTPSFASPSSWQSRSRWPIATIRPSLLVCAQPPWLHHPVASPLL
jgi:hypothetical protein